MSGQAVHQSGGRDGGWISECGDIKETASEKKKYSADFNSRLLLSLCLKLFFSKRKKVISPSKPLLRSMP